MARLLLLRHAQSTWNALGRWQGHADPPLSAEGEAEVAAARGRLPAFPAVVASDRQRARRTAELLASAWGLDRVERDAALRERDVGELSGLTAVEVDERFPGLRAAGLTPPGWERDDALLARVLPRLEALSRRAEPELLVVTHGGVIRAVVEHLGAPRGEAVARNLSGHWIERGADGLHLGEPFGEVDPSAVRL
jgi:broad specificity phosphatase PhoE